MTAASFYARRGKRVLDVALVLLGAPIALPVVVLVSLASRVLIGTPVLFRQARPGRFGQAFTLLKLRTMVGNEHGTERALPDADRLTSWGRLLRSTSLDELPELWNVLVGDMSLVGPRPLLTEYLPLYDERQSRRHEVRPGITGWAQVNGRNALSWEQKFELDVWYVENVSLALDLKILWRTLASVVRREGISAVGEATMPKFKGTTA